MSNEEYELIEKARNKIITIFKTRLSAFNEILGTAAFDLGKVAKEKGYDYDEKYVDELIYRMLNVFKEQIDETHLWKLYNKGFEGVTQ